MNRLHLPPSYQFPIHRRAFTRVEITIVIVAMAILVAVATQQVHGRAERTRRAATRHSLDAISAALRQFEDTAGRFPTTDEGLAALLAKPADLPDKEWQGPYLKGNPVDGWKREFIYHAPGDGTAPFRIVSLGRDNREGTTDDVAL